MTSRQIISTALLFSAGWFAAAAAWAQHRQHRAGNQAQHAERGEKAPARPLCPVGGQPVDFSVRTMTADGPVYFCCPGCVDKFRKNPAKYAEKVAAQRAALKKLERVQVTCPVTGKPIDGKTSAVIGGQRVSFCCPGCVARYRDDPGKHRAQLEASYTYQTRCPVMGGQIDPTSYTDLPTGQRVYFCCAGCEARLLADPDKYVPNLVKQGVKIDIDRLKAALARKSADRQPKPEDRDAGGHP